MALPEYIQQVFVRDLGRVIDNLDRLRVITQTVIGWVLFAPSCVSHTGTNHAFDATELGIRTPESAQCKCRDFGLGRHGGIYGWYRAIGDEPIFGQFHCISLLGVSKSFPLIPFIFCAFEALPEDLGTHSKPFRDNCFSLNFNH